MRSEYNNVSSAKAVCRHAELHFREYSEKEFAEPELVQNGFSDRAGWQSDRDAIFTESVKKKGGN